MKWVRHMADYSQKEKELEREHLEKLVKEEDRSIKPMKEFESPEDLYHELIASVRKYHPSADISLIEKAYHVARDAHEGQTRKSGEPYIVHPLCVAIILAELELDKETIAAGLLHDVLEDTVMTADEIKEEFSEEVLLLVDGVTKLRHLHLADNSHNHDQKDRKENLDHIQVNKNPDDPHGSGYQREQLIYDRCHRIRKIRKIDPAKDNLNKSRYQIENRLKYQFPNTSSNFRCMSARSAPIMMTLPTK